MSALGLSLLMAGSLQAGPAADAAATSTSEDSPATSEDAAATPEEDAAATSEDAAEQPEDAAAHPEDPAAGAGEGGSEAAPGDLIDVEPEPEPEPELEPEPQPGPTVAVAPAKKGPPFYDDADTAKLRARYGISPEVTPARPGKWRCLVPDPACGFQVELVATSAYTFRMRQGDVSVDRDVETWHSGRAAYDLWIDIPVLKEVSGQHNWTRMTMGPKGGVIVSDSHDVWGDAGFAMRYWFGRGKWAPAIELTTALTFKLRGQRGTTIGPQRSPVGISADVGFSMGGWGAIVVGGQFDSPLAREELPEKFRISSGGQVFVGFRGNILWGGPAALGVATHALTHRNVTAP